MKNYVRFASINPRLDFTFLHPGDWQVREVKGADYDEVSILGPRNREGTYNLAVMVRVTSVSEKGGQYISLRELIADYLARSKRSSGFQEISRAYGYLAGIDATEIEISYLIPLPINTVSPKETLIVERRIFLKRVENFIEVVYRAVEEDYYRYLEAFKDLVRTFEFRDDAAQRVYRPLIIPVPTHVTHEHPVEYKTDTDES